MSTLPRQCYVSAPMSGYPEHNFPELDRVAGLLRNAGVEVCNPADNFDRDVTRPRADYMLKDVQHVLDCEAVVLCRGWSESRGCNCEVMVAWETGKPVYLFEDEPEDGRPFRLTPVNITPAALPYSTNPKANFDSILMEADNLVNGPRRSTYGHPLDDYTKVSAMLNALYAHKLKEPFVAEDVPMIMQLVKLSREVHCPKRDNRVDGAGYWGVRQMIFDERTRRQSTPHTE